MVPILKMVGLLLLVCTLVIGQTDPGPPNLVGFVGVSADPNGGLNDVALDIGGAKLVGSSTYLGLVAHMTRATDVTQRVSTKLQFHVAQKLTTFRKAGVFWTGEVGPDWVSSQAVASPPALAGPMVSNVGYALGSGPLISVPLTKVGQSLGFHAEFTKGSMSDVGFRGGVLFTIGGG